MLYCGRLQVQDDSERLHTAQCAARNAHELSSFQKYGRSCGLPFCRLVASIGQVRLIPLGRLLEILQ